MKHLPLIVGFGGYNAAGRSSGHNGYKRMVYESLSAAQQHSVVRSLAGLAGREVNPEDAAQAHVVESILKNSLVRRIEASAFDPDRVQMAKNCELEASAQSPILLTIASRDVPNPLPSGWAVKRELQGRCEIEISTSQNIRLETQTPMPVQAAGQLPSGFMPESYYRSTHHPRGLQLTVLAASDALRSTGMKWETIVNYVRPDQVGVYASSVMSQLDNNGLGGMLQARFKGQRVTSKQLPLGLSTMPADFVNAYLLGSVGSTAGVVGACATFAYNLNAAVKDIQSGRRKVVMVGSSEAPIIPEIIDGYAAMSALATDDDLRRLDGTCAVDYRRYSRPFGDNSGFTLAESGQYVMLMADDLALELGAINFGAVPGVFVNADGFKKSISAPGPGNYITMAKAVALAQKSAGKQVVQSQSFIQAHGSSTPQNRVTESKIFDEVAKAFDIQGWPVSAVKAYVGHSLGPASGDQLACSLGVFAHGIVPGIKTIDAVASDVFDQRLTISTTDQMLGPENCQVAFLNSKGFGGNNATATIFSPQIASQMLQAKYSSKDWRKYEDKLSVNLSAAAAYEAQATQGQLSPVYHFGESVVDVDDLALTSDAIKIPGFAHSVLLTGEPD